MLTPYGDPLPETALQRSKTNPVDKRGPSRLPNGRRSRSKQLSHRSEVISGLLAQQNGPSLNAVGDKALDCSEAAHGPQGAGHETVWYSHGSTRSRASSHPPSRGGLLIGDEPPEASTDATTFTSWTGKERPRGSWMDV